MEKNSVGLCGTAGRNESGSADCRSAEPGCADCHPANIVLPATAFFQWM